MCVGDIDREMEIEHFSHEHRLTQRANEVRCSGCWHTINGPTYNCSLCNFFLHEQCSKLSREILHPLHSPHPLILYSCSPYNPKSCICSACRKTCHGFVYHCAKCKFDLCLECVSVKPVIKYEGHDHLFSFFEKLHGNNHKCNVCYTLCDAFVIRCVPCEFNFHIHCFPLLPRTITHKCHSCPLTLTDPLTFLTRSGDSSEFYCGACEKKDSPKNSVYYCVDCDYAAHIECVVSEVLSSLVPKRDSVARAEEAILAKLDEETKKGRAEVDTAVEKIDAEIKRLRAELSPAHAKLDQGITKLCDEVKAMKAELSPARAKLDQAITKLCDEVKAMKAELNPANAKLDQAITKLCDEVKTMKAELSPTNAKLEQAITKLSEEVKAMKAKVEPRRRVIG